MVLSLMGRADRRLSASATLTLEGRRKEGLEAAQRSGPRLYLPTYGPAETFGAEGPEGWQDVADPACSRSRRALHDEARAIRRSPGRYRRCLSQAA
jgi:hypothetical protein